MSRHMKGNTLNTPSVWVLPANKELHAEDLGVEMNRAAQHKHGAALLRCLPPKTGYGPFSDDIKRKHSTTIASSKDPQAGAGRNMTQGRLQVPRP